MNIYVTVKKPPKSDKKQVHIVTHKLQKTKERIIRKIIMQCNTDIWIYEIEAIRTLN